MFFVKKSTFLLFLLPRKQDQMRVWFGSKQDAFIFSTCETTSRRFHQGRWGHHWPEGACSCYCTAPSDKNKYLWVASLSFFCHSGRKKIPPYETGLSFRWDVISQASYISLHQEYCTADRVQNMDHRAGGWNKTRKDSSVPKFFLFTAGTGF